MPGDAFGSCCSDGVDDLSFALSPVESCPFEEIFLDGAFVVGLGFVVLEPLSEFVGMVEDLLD